MKWLFKLKEKSKRFIIYSYARESNNLDGEIIYDLLKQSCSVLTMCSKDKDDYDRNYSLEMFDKVIREGFPEERQISLG